MIKIMPKRKPGQLTKKQAEAFLNAAARGMSAEPGSKEVADALAEVRAIREKANKETGYQGE